MNAKPETPQDGSDKKTTLGEFLVSTPPNTWVTVDKLTKVFAANEGHALDLPLLELTCGSPTCAGGIRVFQPTSREYPTGMRSLLFASYVCRNCGTSRKDFALVVVTASGVAGKIMKLGEYPAFGPNTPPRLISLVGPERDYFLKGRSAESLGLGIGAFTYYRRVVENQWQRFLDQIIAVATKIEASPEMIADLKAAQNETQFSAAVDRVKHGIPGSLLVSGQNPLTLLFGALSDGLHARTDTECLEIAGSIRMVLEDMADRLASALAEKRELDDAVKKLMDRTAQRAKKSAPENDAPASQP